MERTIAATDGRVVDVRLAPMAVEHESKRVDLFEEDGTRLAATKDVLHERTVAKNREFQRHLDALKQRISRYEGRLREEESACEAEHESIYASVEAAVRQVGVEYERRIHAEFDAIEETLLPALSRGMDKLEADLRHFVEVTVPQVIDRQNGAVVRALLKSRERFDIENSKLLKREARIEARFEQHKAHSLAGLALESKTMKERMLMLEEDVNEKIRVEDRAEELLQTRISRQILKLKVALKAARDEREREDVEILQSLESTLSLLQQSIIKHFGMGPDAA
eukprot:PLAT470.2.p1 GENE.PLAT470.2~~PLAT470.2.p1  ORF type:complete len:281 (-),score=110.73 PLAT470.2:89-931(-)